LAPNETRGYYYKWLVPQLCWLDFAFYKRRPELNACDILGSNLSSIIRGFFLIIASPTLATNVPLLIGGARLVIPARYDDLGSRARLRL
jgi:hypothetical protein